MFPSIRHVHQLLPLPEELASTYNGPETTTQEVLFDLLGPKLQAQTHTLTLTLESKKFTVTKLEDADQMMLHNLMEEILDLLMEAQELAKHQSTSPVILPKEHGLFNGLGSEELSL